MALNIVEITSRDGVEYQNAYAIVETAGSSANLGIWTDHTKEHPVRWSGLASYEVGEDPEADTIAKLGELSISASVIEE
jgi:hypothetical protein